MAERPAAPATSTFVDVFGGPRGLLESALPATVFVLVRMAADSLLVAGALALLSGVVLLVLRLRRGESLQQVGSGFFGLVIAVLVSRATGTGEGFFLPGIVTTALSGVGFFASLAFRTPAVGLALQAYDPRYNWRTHEGLRHACTVATAVWGATFLVRAGVATYVYRLDGDNDGLLFVVINVVKWSLIAGAALVTVVLVKRSGFVREEPGAQEAA